MSSRTRKYVGLTLIGLVSIMAIGILLYLYSDKKEFSRAQKTKSEIVYINYIKNYPKGIYVKEAKKQADRFGFINACNRDNVASYTKYLLSYRGGNFVEEAKQRRHNLISEEAIKLEKKLLWKEAGSLWQVAYDWQKDYDLTENKEALDRKETCEYKLEHPVGAFDLEKISVKPIGYIGTFFHEGNIYFQYDYSVKEYSHQIITFSAKITSIQAEPIRSVVVRLSDWLYKKDSPRYDVEILRGKILLPGQSITVKFKIKTKAGDLGPTDIDVIKVDNKETG